ncbi:MAG TPA: tetratricopeptide repeat protein [Planctomycetota bacterium]|nr:tetratricopeptide repeat protein [Planctomycetota bacterium]
MNEGEPPATGPQIEERTGSPEDDVAPGEESARHALATLRAPDPPEMFDGLVAEGLALLEAGSDLAGAAALLERAAAIRADDPELAYALGVIYGGRALERLRRAQAALFHDATATEALLAKAIFCYLRAVELDPREPDPWNNLATLYAVRGDRELAIEALKRSLQVRPDQPRIRDRLEELGDF